MEIRQGLIVRPLRRAQRGVSLLFALMALIVLSLGAVALLRSVDTGLLVLGNLGFKQDALAAGSVGTETAISWLQANAGTGLDNSQAAKGYSAVAMTAVDPTGRTVAAGATKATLINWTGSCVANDNTVCATPSAEIDAQGSNKVRYFITRLCEKEGPADSTNDCVAPVSSQSTGSTTQRGSLGYGQSIARFGSQTQGTYYRIITRTEGVRGTVSYTETLVHF
ncbi:pilus assembly PilX family protein [Roseateles violae]|uniref:Tfp pilus assembly protein PilX n=1 Tax=Roseateles violae TaxID=3058042 RepID=A0ABT8DS04_9BURK|nr:hypothetical protein [Pelomonas sp. PFR6]MDN3921114.1 hypothetical protein [Pelomonas sp. PFR6]